MLSTVKRAAFVALVVTTISVTCNSIARKSINKDDYQLHKHQKSHFEDQTPLNHGKLRNELLHYKAHKGLDRNYSKLVNEQKPRKSMRSLRVSRQAYQANSSLYPNLPYNQQGGNYNNPYGHNQPGYTNPGQQPPYNTHGYQQPYNPTSYTPGSSYPGNTQYPGTNNYSNFNLNPPYNTNPSNRPQFNLYNQTHPHYPTYNPGQKPPFTAPNAQYQPRYNQSYIPGNNQFNYNNQNPQHIGPGYPQPNNQFNNPTNQGYPGQTLPYGTYNPAVYSPNGQQNYPAVTQSPYGSPNGQYPSNNLGHTNSNFTRFG